MSLPAKITAMAALLVALGAMVTSAIVHHNYFVDMREVTGYVANENGGLYLELSNGDGYYWEK